MKFFDGPEGTDSIPQWADFLINLGYSWFRSSPGPRRIGLISLPCDSAGAGLVALGVVRQRLEDEDASDGAWHLDRIMACARGEKSEILLRHRVRKGRFRVITERSDGVWLREEKTAALHKVLPNNAHNWQFEDEPFIAVQEGNGIPYAPLYEGLA